MYARDRALILFSLLPSVRRSTIDSRVLCSTPFFFYSLRLSLIAMLGVFYGLLLYPQVRGNTCNSGGGSFLRHDGYYRTLTSCNALVSIIAGLPNQTRDALLSFSRDSSIPVRLKNEKTNRFTYIRRFAENLCLLRNRKVRYVRTSDTRHRAPDGEKRPIESRCIKDGYFNAFLLSISATRNGVNVPGS